MSAARLRSVWPRLSSATASILRSALVDTVLPVSGGPVEDSLLDETPREERAITYLKMFAEAQIDEPIAAAEIDPCLNEAEIQHLSEMSLNLDDQETYVYAGFVGPEERLVEQRLFGTFFAHSLSGTSIPQDKSYRTSVPLSSRDNTCLVGQ